MAISLRFNVMIVLPSNDQSLEFLLHFSCLLSRRISFYLFCACFCVSEDVACPSSALGNLLML